MLRGLATISFWADDLKAARTWYSELLGISPYFERPDSENPAYIEFRLGDYQHELGIIDTKYAPRGAAAGPGGVVAYWHVDDVAETLEKLTALGAKEYEPLTHREAGWITASVVDPFGNILGIIYNPHYLEILDANGMVLTGTTRGQQATSGGGWRQYMRLTYVAYCPGVGYVRSPKIRRFDQQIAASLEGYVLPGHVSRHIEKTRGPGFVGVGVEYGQGLHRCRVYRRRAAGKQTRLWPVSPARQTCLPAFANPVVDFESDRTTTRCTALAVTRAACRREPVSLVVTIRPAENAKADRGRQRNGATCSQAGRPVRDLPHEPAPISAGSRGRRGEPGGRRGRGNESDAYARPRRSDRDATD